MSARVPDPRPRAEAMGIRVLYYAPDSGALDLFWWPHSEPYGIGVVEQLEAEETWLRIWFAMAAIELRGQSPMIGDICGRAIQLIEQEQLS